MACSNVAYDDEDNEDVESPSSPVDVAYTLRLKRPSVQQLQMCFEQFFAECIGLHRDHNAADVPGIQLSKAPPKENAGTGQSPAAAGDGDNILRLMTLCRGSLVRSVADETTVDDVDQTFAELLEPVRQAVVAADSTALTAALNRVLDRS